MSERISIARVRAFAQAAENEPIGEALLAFVLLAETARVTVNGLRRDVPDWFSDPEWPELPALEETVARFCFEDEPS